MRSEPQQVAYLSHESVHYVQTTYSLIAEANKLQNLLACPGS